MASSRQPWWTGGVLYQAYPRSFADSNDDGIGDLAGLRARLDYLHWLGVDGIWISPTFPSPNRDWGYDVSDYRRVHPGLGTIDDLDALIVAADELGIRRGGGTAVALNLTDSPVNLSLAGEFLLSTKRCDDPSRLEPWEGVVVALT